MTTVYASMASSNRPSANASAAFCFVSITSSISRSESSGATSGPIATGASASGATTSGSAGPDGSSSASGNGGSARAGGADPPQSLTSSSKQAGASAELARAASPALRTAAMSSALSEGIV